MKKISIIIILLICMVALLGIGFLMTANETNINKFKNITLADGTTIGIPADFTVKKPFSNYTENDGFYYTNCDLESKNYGWIHIEYTHDPVETMAHGSNSTDAIDADNDGVYEFNVYDIDGHRVMKIRGSNPAVVKAIGKTVKLPTNNTTTKVNNTAEGNTTVEKVSTNNNNNQQNNNNEKKDITDKPTRDLSKNTVDDDIAIMKQSRDNGGHYSGLSDKQIEERAYSYHNTVK